VLPEIRKNNVILNRKIMTAAHNQRRNQTKERYEQDSRSIFSKQVAVRLGSPSMFSKDKKSRYGTERNGFGSPEALKTATKMPSFAPAYITVYTAQDAVP